MNMRGTLTVKKIEIENGRIDVYATNSAKLIRDLVTVHFSVASVDTVLLGQQIEYTLS